MKKVRVYILDAIGCLIVAVAMLFIKKTIWGNVAIVAAVVSAISSAFTAVKLYKAERQE